MPPPLRPRCPTIETARVSFLDIVEGIGRHNTEREELEQRGVIVRDEDTQGTKGGSGGDCNETDVIVARKEAGEEWLKKAASAAEETMVRTKDTRSCVVWPDLDVGEGTILFVAFLMMGARSSAKRSDRGNSFLSATSGPGRRICRSSTRRTKQRTMPTAFDSGRWATSLIPDFGALFPPAWYPLRVAGDLAAHCAPASRAPCPPAPNRRQASSASSSEHHPRGFGRAFLEYADTLSYCRCRRRRRAETRDGAVGPAAPRGGADTQPAWGRGGGSAGCRPARVFIAGGARLGGYERRVHGACAGVLHSGDELEDSSLPDAPGAGGGAVDDMKVSLGRWVGLASLARELLPLCVQ